VIFEISMQRSVVSIQRRRALRPSAYRTVKTEKSG
jgi:hypothetical protein